MADMIPLTVGGALAYKQRGDERVAMTSFGDAATFTRPPRAAADCAAA